MKETGLVTVLFKSDNVLDGFIKSLSIQNYKDYHLFIIDNSPSLETDQLLKELSIKYVFSQFTHIKNENNEGVAKGNNQGIQLSLEAETKYTLLLNNDIEFEDPSLLTNLLEQSKNENLVIPKILYYDTRKIWVAGGKFILYKGIIEHFGDGAESSEYNEEIYCSYSPTCFMLIKNDVFKKIGIMDEKYFVYYDDTDFIYRAYVEGYQIKYLPNLVVLHKVSSSTGGNDSPFSIYYSNRNRIYFIKKNFKGFNYVLAMFITLITRIWKYYKYSKNEKQKLYGAIVDGLKM